MYKSEAKSHLLSIVITILWFAFAVHAQRPTYVASQDSHGQPATATFDFEPSLSDEIATAYRISSEDGRWLGDLYITINGSERKISERASKAWIISSGKEVALASDGGAGGYENEGQTLHIYTVKTQEIREVLSHYYMIDEVKEVKLSSDATALLVSMSDGGAGNPYLAVVDPKRGEVFFRRLAKVAEVKDDTVTINIYRAGDWDEPYPPENGSEPKPKSSKTIPLNEVLKNKIICNKPDHRSGRRTSC